MEIRSLNERVDVPIWLTVRSKLILGGKLEAISTCSVEKKHFIRKPAFCDIDIMSEKGKFFLRKREKYFKVLF